MPALSTLSLARTRAARYVSPDGHDTRERDLFDALTDLFASTDPRAIMDGGTLYDELYRHAIRITYPDRFSYPAVLIELEKYYQSRNMSVPEPALVSTARFLVEQAWGEPETVPGPDYIARALERWFADAPLEETWLKVGPHDG